MISVAIGDYRMRLTYEALPNLYRAYRGHAKLIDEFALDERGAKCYVGVERAGDGWPRVVVAQTYDPSGGFYPGVLLVPDTHVLFIGAGTRLLCYRLVRPERLWEYRTEC